MITNKDEYLAFRSAWRTAYKLLSAIIRKSKTDFKNTQRSGTTAEIRDAQLSLNTMRYKARTMLEARQISKTQASQNYVVGAK